MSCGLCPALTASAGVAFILGVCVFWVSSWQTVVLETPRVAETVTEVIQSIMTDVSCIFVSVKVSQPCERQSELYRCVVEITMESVRRWVSSEQGDQN